MLRVLWSKVADFRSSDPGFDSRLNICSPGLNDTL
jgi:hypothetical protein